MTKAKPVPELDEAEEAQPLAEEANDSPEPVAYRRSPMEDPTHPLHHLRDA
jgi:hypothetical protein